MLEQIFGTVRSDISSPRRVCSLSSPLGDCFREDVSGNVSNSESQYSQAMGFWYMRIDESAPPSVASTSATACHGVAVRYRTRPGTVPNASGLEVGSDRLQGLRWTDPDCPLPRVVCALSVDSKPNDRWERIG